ncbi:MAG: hypothetical protein JWM75_492 [Sphingomonas bacterium]|nr:hypothetical protein [Sphingomonas bacterium]
MSQTETSRGCIEDYARLLFVECEPMRAFAKYFARDLIQHDPDIGDGHQGDEEFLEARREADPDAYLTEDQYATVGHAIIADGDLVMLKSHCFTSRDDAGRVFVDIWRVADQKFVEHWSAIEPIRADAANPLPAWCGTGGSYEEAHQVGDTVAQPLSGHSGDAMLRDASLAAARGFLDAIERGDDAAAAGFVDADTQSFDPRVARAGGSGLVERFAEARNRGDQFWQARWMGDGEFALVHGRLMSPDHSLGFSQMHLFRVADGRILAHWGVRQAIPTYSVAGRSMVEGPLEEGRQPGGPLTPAVGH